MIFVILRLFQRDIKFQNYNTMKIFTKLFLVTLLLSAVTMVTNAEGLIHPIRPVKQVKNAVAVNTTAPKALKSVKRDAEGSRVDILVDEDFHNVTGGSSTKQPGEDLLLASSETDKGIYIDSDLTSDGTWAGNNVYAGDGSIVLLSSHPQRKAYLQTPLGDYSGDITVTCKVRAFDTIYYGIAADGGDVKSTGSDFDIVCNVGGYESTTFANWDGETGYDTRLYTKQGWTEVTYTFRNYSANADGYIEFRTEAGVAIDWIKITTSNAEFIAEPNVTNCKFLTDKSFQIDWDPVRKSYNYYVDLWKKTYTGDENEKFTADFEDCQLPEGFSVSGDYCFDDVNGSTALEFPKNIYFQTPNNNSYYNQFAVNLGLQLPAGMDPEEEYSMVYIDGLTDNGWKTIGYIRGSDLANTSVNMDLAYALGDSFAGTYYAIRIYSNDMDDELISIDNVSIEAGRPSKLERVSGTGSLITDTDNDDYNYNYNCITYDTSKTFTGLSVIGDYYYRVRSHFVLQFSNSLRRHAFGCIAPTLYEATNVTKDGYTANWKEPKRATYYNVINYGVESIMDDEEEHIIMNETFEKALNGYEDPEAETMTVVPGEIGDEYTDYPGWTGYSNFYGYNMFGIMDGGYLITPPMYLANNENYYLYILAYGTAGDYLQLNDGSDTYYITFQTDEETGSGYINGTYLLPVASDLQQLKFYSYSRDQIALRQVAVMQDVTAGDKVYVFQKQADVEAGNNSYTFSGLQDSDFGEFAYALRNHYTLEGRTATSDLSEFKHVTVNSAKTVIRGIEDNTIEAHEVARYSLDGKQVGSSAKGINIVKMSDGRVVKIINK